MALGMGAAVGLLAAACALLFVSSFLVRLGMALLLVGLGVLHRRLPTGWTAYYTKVRRLWGWVFTMLGRSAGAVGKSPRPALALSAGA